MAPVICVALSHRVFGRPFEHGGSCRWKYHLDGEPWRGVPRPRTRP